MRQVQFQHKPLTKNAHHDPAASSDKEEDSSGGSETQESDGDETVNDQYP